MQRRASVLATVVMAPSLVDYADKARKAWQGRGVKPLKAEAAAPPKAAAPAAQPG